jgi:glutathione S-transferase
VAGDKPTLADFSLAGYVFYPPEEGGYEWAKVSPNLAAWMERVCALPGWKDPYALMPGERLKPLR